MSMYPNPMEEEQVRAQLEHKSLEEERPPERRPGDNFILFGAIAGALFGIVIGLKTANPFFFVPAGLIIGGIAGVGVGSLIKNMVMRRSKQR